MIFCKNFLRLFTTMTNGRFSKYWGTEHGPGDGMAESFFREHLRPLQRAVTRVSRRLLDRVHHKRGSLHRKFGIHIRHRHLRAPNDVLPVSLHFDWILDIPRLDWLKQSGK